MPFAVVATSNTTADTSSASVTVAMPSGIVAGDLIMVFWAQDAVGVITQSGGSDWTDIDQGLNGVACSGGCFAKIAAGGDSLTLASLNSQDFACVAVRITGHGVANVSTDITKGTAATGSDAAPEPPNCNPGTAKDYLWLETFAADDDDETTPYESTSYTAVAQIQSANSTSSCLVAVARRALNASAENPGAMAMSATEEWRAQTFAIPPGPVTGTAAGTIPVTTGSASGDAEHTGTAAGNVPVPSGSASGTVNTTITGTAAGSVPVPIGSATGEAEHHGTAAGAIPVSTGSASGEVEHHGAADGLIPVPTGSATGTVDAGGPTGTAAGNVPVPTGSASGTAARAGVAAGTLPIASSSAAAQVAHHGAATGQIPTPTGEASSSTSKHGTASGALPTMQGSASGLASHVGSAAGLLPVMRGSATGTSITELFGTAAGMLPVYLGQAQGFVGEEPDIVAGIARIEETALMAIEILAQLLTPAGHIPEPVRTNVSITTTGVVLAAADAERPILLIGGSLTAALDTTVEIRENNDAGAVLATQFLATGIPFPLALLAIDVPAGTGLWLEPTGVVAVTGRAVSLVL